MGGNTSSHSCFSPSSFSSSSSTSSSPSTYSSLSSSSVFLFLLVFLLLSRGWPGRLVVSEVSFKATHRQLHAPFFQIEPRDSTLFPPTLRSAPLTSSPLCPSHQRKTSSYTPGRLDLQRVKSTHNSCLGGTTLNDNQTPTTFPSTPPLYNNQTYTSSTDHAAGIATTTTTPATTTVTATVSEWHPTNCEDAQ
eukprot:GHVT01016585.1.p1 GENE.GHVT01016585.1~~GHVT01016585.1.p1  ORF type:complete len:192 (+),score=49.49 GHVT01016585.1:286-861(+)